MLERKNQSKLQITAFLTFKSGLIFYVISNFLCLCWKFDSHNVYVVKVSIELIPFRDSSATVIFFTSLFWLNDSDRTLFYCLEYI